MWYQVAIILVTVLCLSACAINDVPVAETRAPETASPEPALVLNPPDEFKLAGDCNVTSQLEAWLQITVPAREDFEARLAEAVAKSPSEMVDDVWSLVSLRNTVYSTPTPDCALESQFLLASAFNQGIDTLKAVVNNAFDGDLAESVIEVNAQLIQAAQLQDELVYRMEEQYKAQNLLPGG